MAVVKNQLPVDFLNVVRLRNLFRHIDALSKVDLHGLVIEKAFAGLLKHVLEDAYPSLW